MIHFVALYASRICSRVDCSLSPCQYKITDDDATQDLIELGISLRIAQPLGPR